MNPDETGWPARIRGLFRLLGGFGVAAVLVPPLMLGVAAATLLEAPLPAGNLPDEKPQPSAVPSVVLDVNGAQIATFRSYDRTLGITPADIPATLSEAVVAIEDQRFYEHNGVDVEGVARAARVNVGAGGIAQGGSTITQQYVKNVYLSQEQTLERKVEEALLAIEVEKRMTKAEILYGYLTSSYFGEGAYGAGAAAEVYFTKPVSELDLSEAATLAGLLQAPSRLSPRNDVDAAERRRRLVLEAMRDQHKITEDEFQEQLVRRLWLPEMGPAPEGPVTLVAPRPANGATAHPYFVDWVEADLVERFGPDLVYKGGLTIQTTIDPHLQQVAEQAAWARLSGTDWPVEMSLVSLDPTTGHVVAMVGGRDYVASQVNLATGGSTGFQPGSSFKPFVLAAGFERGIGPETVYPAPGRLRVPGCSGTCTISNYDGSGYGSVTLRRGMELSINTVSVGEIMDVGVANTVELARRLGLERIDPEGDYGVSLALGAAETSPLEMASAYGVFANRGVRVEPTGLLRVSDAAGNVLVDNTAPAGVPVLDQAAADTVTDVLVGVIERGTGTAAKLDRPAAGKTGTAQNYSAAWFVGYTPRLSTAVWMGHADGVRPLIGINGVGRVTGGSHPATAWRQYMTEALAGTEPIPFPVPGPLVVPGSAAAEVGSGRETPTEVEYRPTTVRGQRATGALAADCGGRACSPTAGTLPRPVLPPSERPTTTAPPTTRPPTIRPTTPPSTAPPTSGTSPTTPPTSPPTTAPPSSATTSTSRG
ncbi:MAG: transglycosylase domain-containing protein [Acidimicrobiales bacterium]